MKSRTFGTLQKQGSHWVIRAEPHIMMKVKRVLSRVNPYERGSVSLSDCPENCHDLEWFLQRYPLETSAADQRLLRTAVREHRKRVQRIHKYIQGEIQSEPFEMALPPRPYQSQAARILLEQGYLILGDDVGLGKTISGICTLTDPRTLPAVVVTLPGLLPKQWETQIQRFAPQLRTHVVQSLRPYPLPEFFGRAPDVVILNYHKLSSWAEYLASYARSVIYDEIQELRRPESQKYSAAIHLSRNTESQMGLTATPIFNFGEEFYHVVTVLRQGLLGAHDEFLREWCLPRTGEKQARLADPRAFGHYLRDQGIMLRRTRKDVQMELPPISRIPYPIDADPAALNAIQSTAVDLARTILRGTNHYRNEQRDAAGELNNLLRHATGIAKAPAVAAFTRMLIETGEKVLLYGWHREVYAIWEQLLGDFHPAFFTGSESPSQKQRSYESFLKGETPLLIMSLRSGAGLDGLQHVCRTAVFGELDWSPGVIEQCIGRLARDGQEEPVFAYFPLSEQGSDPVMAEILGIKQEQIEGVRNPEGDFVETLDSGGAQMRRLAEEYLRICGSTASSAPAN